jgi:CRP/FNR family cyclic AMP-dependent transcriptional regulator
MYRIDQLPLFASLPEDRVARYSSSVSCHVHGENELIIDYGDASTDVLFVITGKVRVLDPFQDGRDLILDELGPGQFFGEMAAIDGHPRSASATALVKTRIYRMAAAQFLEILTHEPEVCRTVLRILVARVRDLDMRLGEHAFLSAKQRLYAELMRLSKPRSVAPGQRVISPPPLQRNLADRIGCRREVVSRELGILAQAGLIERAPGALVLVAPREFNRLISTAHEPEWRAPR